MPVPEAARGRWCLLLAGRLDVQHTIPSAEILGPDGAVLRRAFLGHGPGGQRTGGGCWGVVHMPGEASTIHVTSVGRVAPGAVMALRVRPIGAAAAAALLIASRPSALRQAWRSGGPRAALSTLAVETHAPKTLPAGGYARWLDCFEPGVPDLPPRHSFRIGALVVQPPGTPPDAVAATLGSLGADVPRAIAACGDWRGAARLAVDYLAVLQAGEVMRPQWLRLAGAALERLGRPAIAIPDMDHVTAQGLRHAPEFRPEPNHALMLSGTLSRGAWLVRRDALDASMTGAAPDWAELLRLRLWLQRYEQGKQPGRRIPVVISHRRHDAPAAPAALLAAETNAHLTRLGLPLATGTVFPLRPRATPDARGQRMISLIIASGLREPHTPRCILDLLAGTPGGDVEVIVAVAQPGPLDPQQLDAARQIEADVRARVEWVPMARFNFSAANNLAARQARGEVLCLVNDDVTPLAPDWLDQMVAHLAAPGAGIVGARMVYPDGTLQHAGVILGAAGVAAHPARGLRPGDAGWHARAELSQEFSAVTGACLMIRRALFTAVGGFDEAYPSAFNDIDLCLQVREIGLSVILAGEATLVHHEGLTYRDHYAGRPEPARCDDTDRMARRWGAQIVDDPFHHPNLSLDAGREWLSAFPPRRASRQDEHAAGAPLADAMPELAVVAAQV